MPFGFSPGGKLDLDASRDLGIALIRHADHLPSGNPLQALAGRALGLLDSALQRDDRDLAAVESRGNALWFLGRLDEAMGTYERVLALAPDRETTLFQAANLSFRLGRLEAARSFAQRLLTVNPWRWEYHLALARIQAQANDWLASRDSCLAARKLNALQPGVSRQLVVCHLRLRNRSEAETEFETLLHLLPAQAEELRRWFSQLR
jgi:tetratricopeptide (TPR) repeat protein